MHGLGIVLLAQLLSSLLLASNAWAVSLNYVSDARTATAGAGVEYVASWGRGSYSYGQDKRARTRHGHARAPGLFWMAGRRRRRSLD